MPFGAMPRELALWVFSLIISDNETKSSLVGAAVRGRMFGTCLVATFQIPERASHSRLVTIPTILGHY